MLVTTKFGFTTTSGKMMATEPGKMATDKSVEPVLDGSQAKMEPIGDVAERVALMNAQEAFGDFEKA